MIDLEDVLDNDYIYSEDAINFCWEIPNLEPLGAVAFQRLFNIQVASVLMRYLPNTKIEVSGDDIFVHDNFIGSNGVVQERGKCSVSITYSKNNVAIGHTGINITAGKKAPSFAYSTHLSDKQCEEFMAEVINAFYDLANSLFIATTKLTIV
jgi:hypothetical protein